MERGQNGAGDLRLYCEDNDCRRLDRSGIVSRGLNAEVSRESLACGFRALPDRDVLRSSSAAEHSTDEGATHVAAAEDCQVLVAHSRRLYRVTAVTRAMYASHRLQAVDVTTWTHPGFPTDLQAPYVSLMTQAEGHCVVSEALFENRFQHVAELNKLGAEIRVEGRSAGFDSSQDVLSNTGGWLCGLGGAIVVGRSDRFGEAAVGSRTRNTVPRPTSLSTVISPP